MTYDYTRNSSYTATNKYLKKDGKFGQNGALLGAERLFTVGENMVFSSARMHGPIGPSKEMTDAFYGDYYTSEVISLFGAQPYNGIQRFTVPTTGKYRFTMMGGYAGGNRYADINDTSIFDTSLTVSHEITIGSTNYTSTSYGCPGYLICEIILNADEIIDILVGHAGDQAVYSNTYTVAGAGGGASVVWVGGFGSSTWAIAGGAGSDRNAGEYTATYDGNAVYGTTGGLGSGGSGGTNGSGGSAGSNSNAGSGAGLNGNGSQHLDNRPTLWQLQDYAQALSGSGWGRGAASASVYLHPFQGTNGGGHYVYIDPTTKKVTQTGRYGLAVDGGVESEFTNYYNGVTTSITGKIPSNGANAGFGGGGCGNWGGAGSGGGYSGGGGGGNGSNTPGGGGSSYVNGFTFISHTTYAKTTDKNHWNCPIQLAPGSMSLSETATSIPIGAWKGNGFINMERIE